MNDVASPQSHSAMRELRQHVLQPVTLTALAGVVVVLTVAGPFGTLEFLSWPERLSYWALLVFSTYTIGSVTDAVLRRALAQQPRAVRILTVSFATALPITAAVVFLNWVMLDLDLLSEGLTISGRIFILALVIAGTLQIVASQRQTPGPVAQQQPQDVLPPLLERLPIDKRGALLAISVEDHYVRVRTSKGEEMLLMRLSDAMRETAPTPGLQVHRSHWVAKAAVTSARREGDRAILSLSHGADIPASRSHIPALREAGLLPK